jgi:hypothetical protein
MERQYASLMTGLWYGSSWVRVVELVYRLHQAPPGRRRHCRRHRRTMTSIVGCGRVSDEEACNVPEVFERICDITIECYTSRIITILNNVVSTPKKTLTQVAPRRRKIPASNRVRPWFRPRLLPRQAAPSAKGRAYP